jgi:hypothetical protein
MKLIVVILILISCSKNQDKGRNISSAEIIRRNYSIDPDAVKKLKGVDWKQTFAEIFSKHINQEKINSQVPYPQSLKIKESIYYNSKPFEEIFLEILKEPSSIEIVEKKEKILSNDRVLESFVKRKLSEKDFFRTKARDLIEILENEFEKENGPIGNYFETSLGKTMMETLKDTVFIILPGFGNHLIQEMVLPDLVEDINEYYGRPRTRPFMKGGLNPGFIDYKEYYGQPARLVQFDIVQPMGKDIGTTFSTHVENAKALKIWIEQLPDFYKEKEIVFVGYSKGATLATQLLVDSPEIRDRTRALISLGGPLQGSSLAEFLSKNIYDLGAMPEFSELNDKIKNLPLKLDFDYTAKTLAKNAFKDNLFFKSLLENLPFISENNKKSLQDLFEKIFYEDSRVILEGLYEEGTSHMLDWNLKYLNQESFDRPIALFNLSFLASYKDFLLRGPIGEDGSKLPPEVVPQFSAKGIDQKNLSLDMVSQLLISLNNQEIIPGGLTDSMVNWNNSKFPIFDPLPLSESYPEEVLSKAYEENVFFKANFTFEEFISTPRKDIFKKRGTGDMDFIDLGEVRGTHWSTMFRQVARLPDSDEKLSHVHSFPHKAMFKALIETYGIYKLIRD